MTTNTEITLRSEWHALTVVLTPEMTPIETTLRDLASRTPALALDAAVGAVVTRVYGDGEPEGVATRAAAVAEETSRRLAEMEARRAREEREQAEQAERELHWAIVSFGPDSATLSRTTGITKTEATRLASRALARVRETEGDRVTGSTVRLYGYRTAEAAAEASISDSASVAASENLYW